MGLPPELVLALLEELPEGIVVLDAQSPSLAVTFVNRAFAALRAEPADALAKLEFATLVQDAEDAVDVAELRGRLARGEHVALRLRAERPGSGPRAVEARFQPLRDPAGQITHFVGFHRLLPAPGEAVTTEARPIQREDRLTGLAHADYFRELYRRDFSIASREGRALTLFMVDIDALGVYNDTFGNQAGDSVIRRVGRTLLSALRRGSDLVARLEGGRFVAFAAGMTVDQSQKHGETLAARIRELHVHHPRSRIARFVTVSVGVATGIPSPGARPDTLLDAAQRALEAARTEGRNRVVARELRAP